MTDRGLSNRGLAAALGFSHVAVADWRNGKRRPHPSTARQLADYFNVSVDDLLDDERELPPEVLPRRRVDPPVTAAPASEVSEVAPASADTAAVLRQVQAAQESTAAALAQMATQHTAALRQIAEQQAALAAEVRRLTALLAAAPAPISAACPGPGAVPAAPPAARPGSRRSA